MAIKKSINLCKKGSYKKAYSIIKKKLHEKNPDWKVLQIYLSILTSSNKINSTLRISKKIVNCLPNSLFSYNNLGNNYKNLKKYRAAIRQFNVAIKKSNKQFNLKVSYYLILKLIKKQNLLLRKKQIKYNSLQNLLKKINNFKIDISLKQLITISRPHFAYAYTNFEYFLHKINLIENKLKNIKKIKSNLLVSKKEKSNYSKIIKKLHFLLKENFSNITITPNYDNPYFNLAFCYEKLGHHEKSLIYYKKANRFESTTRYDDKLFESYYRSNNKKNFIKLAKKFKRNEKLNFNALAASNYVSDQWGIKNYYKFCDDPMEFITSVNLLNEKKIDKKFLNELEKNIVKYTDRTSTPVVIGFKSLGNLLDIKAKVITKFKKILMECLKNYKKEHSNKSSTLISKWPKKFNINAWYIRLSQGGEVTSHVHNGWVSGVFYVKKQKTNVKSNVGKLEISYRYNNLPIKKKNFSKRIINSESGGLVLFPSSLPHRVLPFNSKKERLSIAFDAVPKLI